MVEKNVYRITEKYLLGQENWLLLKKELIRNLDRCSNKEVTLINTSIRMGENYEKKFLKDFLSNLRQFILYTKEIQISLQKFNLIKDLLDDFKLYTYFEENKIYINAKKDMPDWFGKSYMLDSIYSRRILSSNKVRQGDLHLYNMTNYDTYRSEAQKIMIDAVMNMPEGATLMSCMATGQGKSLLALMPRYYSDKKGITLVVVPTVSLAIDQALGANKYFKEKSAIAYHSGLNTKEKKKIKEDLIDNNISIIYTAPESVLTNDFMEIFEELSKRGKFEYLVIDEAHIVHEWGDQFRTEFQLLSIFRKKLLKLSNNKIKTILLSATYTDEATDLLRRLFSENNNFIEIRGDKLRPEIQYYTTVVKSESIKEKYLKEVIALLPRPGIIYVTSLDDSKKVSKLLDEEGFYSHEKFTGEVGGNEREELIKRWNNNDIDLMVATSAFGMGVDKKDVRSVIHYCIPESLNRFYQEVGRGGRDGIQSISLVISYPKKDISAAKSLMKNKILSEEKFIARWQKMMKNPVKQLSGNELWVSSDLKPDYIRYDQFTGRQNTSWNEYVLLKLHKYKLINLKDMFFDNKTGKRYFLLEALNTIMLNSIADLEKFISKSNEEETEIYLNNFNLMKNIVLNSDKRCISHSLVEVYKYGNEVCGGCEFCRKNGFELDYIDLVDEYVTFQSGKNLVEGFKINRKNSSRDKLIKYKDFNLNKIFKYILRLKINTFIIPDNFNLNFKDIDILSNELLNIENYLNILKYSELFSETGEYAIEGNIAILYSNNPQYNKNILGKVVINSKHRFCHIVKDCEVYPGYNLKDRLNVDIEYLD